MANKLSDKVDYQSYVDRLKSADSLEKAEAFFSTGIENLPLAVQRKIADLYEKAWVQDTTELIATRDDKQFRAKLDDVNQFRQSAIEIIWPIGPAQAEFIAANFVAHIKGADTNPLLMQYVSQAAQMGEANFNSPVEHLKLKLDLVIEPQKTPEVPKADTAPESKKLQRHSF